MILTPHLSKLIKYWLILWRPQRWKVPISIVAVNRIDHTDWLDIMVDDSKHLSPRVLISLHNPILLISQCMDNEQMVIVALHFHTSIAQFGSILSWIRILASSIPIRKHRWFTVTFTMLKEQELFFIWHLYEEVNNFKLHIFGVKITTCSFPHIGKSRTKEWDYVRKNQHYEISGSNPPP